MQYKTFLHNGTIGDVIASLPAINECYRKTGQKAILYLVNGQKADYYKGATHPTRADNDKATMVMLNKEIIEKMIPLFNAQECIHETRIWNDERVIFDFNMIRTSFVNMPNGCLSRWYFYVFPDLACDLSKKWLHVPETTTDFAKGKIIISRTERYTNPDINYSFLKEYENDLLFSGTDLERMIFNGQFGLDIKKLETNNFLELAQAVSQCKFHISNQTMLFQISQGLKQPRILETCSFAPNVVPIGENAFDFYHQDALVYYFHLLNGSKDKWAQYLANHPKIRWEAPSMPSSIK